MPEKDADERVRVRDAGAALCEATLEVPVHGRGRRRGPRPRQLLRHPRADTRAEEVRAAHGVPRPAVVSAAAPEDEPATARTGVIDTTTAAASASEEGSSGDPGDLLLSDFVLSLVRAAMAECAVEGDEDALGLLAAEHSTTSSGHGGDGDEPTPSDKLNALLSSRVIPFFEELTDDKLRTAIMNSSLLKDSSTRPASFRCAGRHPARSDRSVPRAFLQTGPPNPPCSVDALLPARVCCGKPGPLATIRVAVRRQSSASTRRSYRQRRGPIPDAEHG